MPPNVPPARRETPVPASDDAAPFIGLAQLLKREALAETGGEAKHAIQSGEVQVNGVVETRRKRKLRDGDVVSYAGREVVVTVEEELPPGL